MRSQKRAASEPLGTSRVPVSQPRGTSRRGGPGPGHRVPGGLWESAGRDPSRPCDSSSGSTVSPRSAGTEAAAGERYAPSALALVATCCCFPAHPAQNVLPHRGRGGRREAFLRQHPRLLGAQ